jgi:hypothetical protein
MCALLLVTSEGLAQQRTDSSVLQLRNNVAARIRQARQTKRAATNRLSRSGFVGRQVAKLNIRRADRRIAALRQVGRMLGMARRFSAAGDDGLSKWVGRNSRGLSRIIKGKARPSKLFSVLRHKDRQWVEVSDNLRWTGFRTFAMPSQRHKDPKASAGKTRTEERASGVFGDGKDLRSREQNLMHNKLGMGLKPIFPNNLDGNAATPF